MQKKIKNLPTISVPPDSQYTSKIEGKNSLSKRPADPDWPHTALLVSNVLCKQSSTNCYLSILFLQRFAEHLPLNGSGADGGSLQNNNIAGVCTAAFDTSSEDQADGLKSSWYDHCSFVNLTYVETGIWLNW